MTPSVNTPDAWNDWPPSPSVMVAIDGETEIETSDGLTVTLKNRLVLFPARSTTVTVSLVLPWGNIDPLDRGTTVVVAMPLSGSVADTLNVTIAPALDVALTV